MKKLKKLFVNYFNRVVGMMLVFSFAFTGMGFVKKDNVKTKSSNSADDFSSSNAEYQVKKIINSSTIAYTNAFFYDLNENAREIVKNDKYVEVEPIDGSIKSYATTGVAEMVTILTNEEKLEVILKKYNLSIDEFEIIVAIVIAESKANSYDDAYAVINTIYNRTRSIKWNYSVDAHSGKGAGLSLYYQAIQPGQFVVYESGAYSKFLGEEVKSLEGYQAIIDMLYDENIMHDFLNFLSSENTNSNRTQFVEGGNNYFGLLEEDDILEIEIEPEEELKLELVR